MPDIPDTIKPYIFHNLLSQKEVSGKNIQVECLSCHSDNCHVAIETGQYQCWACEDKGNLYTFLTKLHSLSLENTKDYSRLVKDRGLPEYILKDHGICESFLMAGVWLVPVYNEKGTITNLYRYDPAAKQSEDRRKFAFLSTPSTKHSLYGIESLSAPPPGCPLKGKALASARSDWPLYVVEGHFDKIAFDHVLRNTYIQVEGKPVSRRSLCDIIAVPGATAFKQDWLRHLHGRDVILLFDHDPPRETSNGHTIRTGQQGMQKIIRLVRESPEFRPTTLKIIEWSKQAA